MASEAVGIILKAEADDVAQATPEPVWGGATLEKTHHEQFVDDLNDQVLLWAPQGHPQGHQQCCPSVAGSASQLPLFVRSMVGTFLIPHLKSSMRAGSEVTSTRRV